MRWTNSDALHRHAYHAWEDFDALRRRLGDEHELWHSLSHHLRHAVYRSAHEVKHPRGGVRRSRVGKHHR